MLPSDRRHLRPGHQALRGDPRLFRRRTIATPGRPLKHLKPTDPARLRDVQLDVHFAVYTHTNTSSIRGENRTPSSLSARGDQLSAYALPRSASRGNEPSVRGRTSNRKGCSGHRPQRLATAPALYES